MYMHVCYYVTMASCTFGSFGQKIKMNQTKKQENRDNNTYYIIILLSLLTGKWVFCMFVCVPLYVYN